MFRQYFLYSLPLVVLLVNRIPYIGKFFRIINTLIHESGHALMAMLTSGEVFDVELFSNRAGQITTKTKNSFSRFLVSVSGYIFGSAFAWFSLWLINSGRIDWVLYLLTSIAVINLAFFVRNTYGIFWLILFSLMLILVIVYGDSDLKYYITMWLAATMLFESLYSSFELLVISYKKPKSAGDAANLQTLTGIHATFWAICFLMQAAFFVYLSVKLFI